MTEEEAGLMAQLLIKPFDTKQAAAIWKVPEAQAQNVLDERASRAVLVDIDSNFWLFTNSFTTLLAVFSP